MSMFSKLMSKVFGNKDAEEETVTNAEEAAGVPEPIEGEAVVAGDVPAPEAAPAPEPMEMVDVEADLNAKEEAHPEDLDWKHSIVDLLKLVDLDSSYGARKEMALELGYSQADIDSKGSAEMNMWLHKEVMKKISENGGKVPGELAD